MSLSYYCIGFVCWRRFWSVKAISIIWLADCGARKSFSFLPPMISNTPRTKKLRLHHQKSILEELLKGAPQEVKPKCKLTTSKPFQGRAENLDWVPKVGLQPKMLCHGLFCFSIFMLISQWLLKITLISLSSNQRLLERICTEIKNGVICTEVKIETLA